MTDEESTPTAEVTPDNAPTNTIAAGRLTPEAVEILAMKLNITPEAAGRLAVILGL